MTTDIIRKKVDSLHEQNLAVLRELAIVVLIVQLVHFVYVFGVGLWETRPLVLGYPIEEAATIALSGDLALLVASSCILILLVRYFFRLRNRPQFHAFFIGRKVEPTLPSRKRVLSSLLVIGTSIGLALTLLVSVAGFFYSVSKITSVYPSYESYAYTLYWWSPYNHDILLPYEPLIFVAFVSVFLYLMYRVRYERMRRAFPLLLFIPIVLSILVTVEFEVGIALNYNTFNYMTKLVEGPGYALGLVEFSLNWIFLTAFVVLLYLTYYYTKIERRGVYTRVEPEHLRGLVEEAVWLLPQKIRENDSRSIWLELKLSEDFMKRACNVNESSLYSSGDYLEAQLQGVGLTVDGEKQMKICETSRLPVTTWSCSFTKRGIHTLNLKLSIVKPTDYMREPLFIQDHEVHVDSFLSISWAPIVVIIAPILALLVQVLLGIK